MTSNKPESLINLLEKVTLASKDLPVVRDILFCTSVVGGDLTALGLVVRIVDLVGAVGADETFDMCTMYIDRTHCLTR